MFEVRGARATRWANGSHYPRRRGPIELGGALRLSRFLGCSLWTPASGCDGSLDKGDARLQFRLRARGGRVAQ